MCLFGRYFVLGEQKFGEGVRIEIILIRYVAPQIGGTFVQRNQLLDLRFQIYDLRLMIFRQV